MKDSIILAALVLLQLNSYIRCSCDFLLVYNDKIPLSPIVTPPYDYHLTCTYFNDNFLAYSIEYENLTYVSLSGNFTEIGFDSRFTKLYCVELDGESRVNLL